MSNRQIDYSFWANQRTWSVGEAVNILTNYYLSRCIDDEEGLAYLKSKKRGHYWWKISGSIMVFASDVERVEWEDPANGVYQITEAGELITPVTLQTHIDVEKFLRWAYSEQIILPPELKVAFTTFKTASESQPQRANEVSDAEDDTFYEDIISDETVMRLKELPLHRLKQQVVMLAGEKKKTDAITIACAKIGLLFYELGLPKPATEKLFVEEYTRHLDKLPDLPKSSLTRLYKHLPEGYRRPTSGGRVAVAQEEIDTIISAATLAGYQCGSKTVATASALGKELKKLGLNAPDDGILAKIVEATKRLEPSDED